MKKMFILKRLYIYNRIEKATAKELELQTKLNELVDEVDRKFDQDKKFYPSDVKDMLKAARERGHDVAPYFRKLDEVIVELNSVRAKKEKLYLSLK